MTRRVDGLVRQGLVVRRACAADGRGSFAQLTEAGVRLMAEAAPTHVAGVRRYLVDAIGPGGLGGLADGLALIENSLDEQPAGR
jgi:DNA-binding MarR family transcriptional regulator